MLNKRCLFHCNTKLHTKLVRPDTDTSPLTMPISRMVGDLCPKCGAIKKSGERERSCCARGGAWFKNCGDVGDTKFDHTWAEGIQACKGRSRKE